MCKKVLRKISLLSLSLFVTVLLFGACGNKKQPEKLPANSLQVPTAIMMSLGETVYYLDGVQAWENGQNITHLIQVTASAGLELDTTNGIIQATTAGTYELTYQVTINNQLQTKTTRLTVCG